MTKEELLAMQNQVQQQTQQPTAQIQPAIIIGLVPSPDGTQALAVQNNMTTVYEAMYILELARDLLKMQAAQGQQAPPASKITVARGNVPRV